MGLFNRNNEVNLNNEKNIINQIMSLIGAKQFSVASAYLHEHKRELSKAAYDRLSDNLDGLIAMNRRIANNNATLNGIDNRFNSLNAQYNMANTRDYQREMNNSQTNRNQYDERNRILAEAMNAQREMNSSRRR